ncbi:ATP-dependent DNA helicase, partial [Caligus rogercresseyi]
LLVEFTLSIQTKVRHSIFVFCFIMSAVPPLFNISKHVEGHFCDTFKQACQLWGLLEDDRQWDLTLEKLLHH